MIDWPDLPLLSLEELWLLPEIVSASSLPCPGVYFLWQSESLAYIGSSKVAKARASSHLRPGDLFGRATLLEIPAPWYAAVEILYIERYRPARNANHNPGGARANSLKVRTEPNWRVLNKKHNFGTHGEV